jgi:hypothetical protein
MENCRKREIAENIFQPRRPAHGLSAPRFSVGHAVSQLPFGVSRGRRAEHLFFLNSIVAQELDATLAERA